MSSPSSPSPLSAPLLPISEDSDGHHRGGEKAHGHARAAFARAAALFSVSAVSFLAGNLSAGGNRRFAAWKSTSSSSPAAVAVASPDGVRTAAANANAHMTPADLSPAEAARLFDRVNALLVAPIAADVDEDDDYDTERYALSDVVLSSALADEFYTLHPNMLHKSWEKASEAREACRREIISGRAGRGEKSLSLSGEQWPCLEPNDDDEEVKKTNEDDDKKKNVIAHADGEHPLPKHQSQPSEHTVAALKNLIRAESVGSIAEFGAGAGQLKAAVLNGVPSLTDEDLEIISVPGSLRYDAYDAAGNVASWTDDFVAHFDPRGPLSLTKADWVVSLGYGGGPGPARRFEGMLIRNLHRHNCRGIVLDLASAVKDAAHPHSRGHVLHVFGGLGYEYDAGESAKFNGDARQRKEEGDVMVFRRQKPVC